MKARRFGLLLATLALAASLSTTGSSQDSRIEEGLIKSDDGVELFYQKTGRARRTLIIPGRLFTFDDFKQLSDEYTIISYDMRGRGRSSAVADGSKLGIHHDVQDLERVRRHFRVERASLIGYSYLGLMVVMYAMDHPERVERIVQIGPVPIKFGTKYPAGLAADDETGDPQELARLRQLRSQSYHLTNPAEYCEREWAYTRFRLVGDPAKVDRLGPSKCDMPNEWPTNLARHFEHSFASVQKLDLAREGIARVRVPVLTIHGTRDRNAPYGAGRDWAMTLPEARLLTVEGAAHQVFAEYPEIVFPAVRRFLGGAWPEKAERVTRLER